MYGIHEYEMTEYTEAIYCTVVLLVIRYAVLFYYT